MQENIRQIMAFFRSKASKALYKRNEADVRFSWWKFNFLNLLHDIVWTGKPWEARGEIKAVSFPFKSYLSE